MVRCCRTYEEVCEGDMGKVIKLDRDGLHDLNVQCDWQHKGGTYWVRYIHVELAGEPAHCRLRPLAFPHSGLPAQVWGANGGAFVFGLRRLPPAELSFPHQDWRQGTCQSLGDHPQVQVGVRDAPERGRCER